MPKISSRSIAIFAGALLRKPVLAASVSIALMAFSPASSRADSVGAAFGAGTGLLVAGPPGAIVGGLVDAVWGHPFWGAAKQSAVLLIDNSFYRHCRYYSGRWHYY
jgi:hypothetical protein